jgi:leucyl aminopeptidase (aminopeptidase T)
MKIRAGESCLILCDKPMEGLASQFYDYVKGLASDSRLEVMGTLKVNGQEPNKATSELMLSYNVQLLLTSKSMSHTKARRDASEQGARVASMPSVTEDVINRSVDIDYEGLKELNESLLEILRGGDKIRIKTKLGTEVEFKIGDLGIHADNGILDQRGSFGNLPAGEVSFSPINGSGKYFVDASFPGLGKLDTPLTFQVKNNLVTGITGKSSKEIISSLDKIGPKAYIIAEVGIGTNPKARVTGKVIEDEKVLGTCHIAVGNNLSYGGSNNVPVHLDGVIAKPTVKVDDKTILEKGKPLF